MKTLLLSLWMLLSIALQAQTLDLSQEEIKLYSAAHHKGGKTGAAISTLPGAEGSESVDKEPVKIEINTKKKNLLFYKERSVEVEGKDEKVIEREVLYDLAYSSANQGAGQSISLKPHETMFMVRDENVFMVTHDAKERTINVIMNDNTVELFGYLEIIK